MRYPEAKIKEAILHPDLEIRARATRYFARAYSPDPANMPLVIKSVKQYGKQDAYRLIGLSRDLGQTEDTVAWVIDELNDESCNKHENYAYNLSMVLVKADPALLLPRESDILQARHFLASLHTALTERLRMLSWDEATCWQRLEEFCEEGKDKQYTDEVNLGYANRIVEALARYGDECEAKVCELLAVELDDYSHHPMKWLEPLMVRLAGQARLESTIPLIAVKLHDDGGDLLNEECVEALSRIGTSPVLNIVADAYSEAPSHFRLYATAPLEYIHSDLAVEKCLRLLPQEKEWDLKRNLAHSLLSHFPQEGIEVVREMLVGRKLDVEDRHLRNYLLETCTLMGEQFPEYEEWLATEKTEKEEHRKRVERLEAEIAKNKAEIERIKAQIAEERKAADQARPQAPSFIPRPLHQRLIGSSSSERARIGRNDPCPCGSGKKFKTCCMRKHQV